MLKAPQLGGNKLSAAETDGSNTPLFATTYPVVMENGGERGLHRSAWRRRDNVPKRKCKLPDPPIARAVRQQRSGVGEM